MSNTAKKINRAAFIAAVRAELPAGASNETCEQVADEADTWYMQYADLPDVGDVEIESQIDEFAYGVTAEITEAVIQHIDKDKLQDPAAVADYATSLALEFGVNAGIAKIDRAVALEGLAAKAARMKPGKEA